MSTIAKVFTVLNLVLALFLVGTVAAILSNGDNFRGKFNSEVAAHAKDNTDRKTDIDRLNGDKALLDTNNKTLTNQKADLESELATAKSTAEQRLSENNQLRNSVDGINAGVKTIQSELADVSTRNKDLMAQNDQLRAASATAEKEKLDAQDDRARLEGDLKRANSDVAEKERQLAEAAKERDNLRAEKDALVAMGVPVTQLIGNNVPMLEGKVSQVDKAGSFVVLSIGAGEGVKIGFPFDIYRGKDYIGRVVVDMVLPDSSTARVTMRNKAGLAFQAMDNATTRL